MTDKPSLPFAETVGLLLKNAGVTADEQLARSLAMAIAIKFQETQQERDDAVWEQAEQLGRAAGLAEAVKVAEEARDMRERLFEQNGGSINAYMAYQAHDIAQALRALSTSPGEHVTGWRLVDTEPPPVGEWVVVLKCIVCLAIDRPNRIEIDARLLRRRDEKFWGII